MYRIVRSISRWPKPVGDALKHTSIVYSCGFSSLLFQLRSISSRNSISSSSSPAISQRPFHRNSNKMDSVNNNIQIFVQSPELKIPTRSIIINPNSTLHHLKHSFLQSIPSQKTLDSLYFTFQGKPLTNETSTLSNSQILQFSNLNLRIRVSGGGGDGGATGAESRDCYLKMYAVKKPDKVDPNETRLSRWTTCSLSFEPLKPPCVIDRLGNVFNKEPLVEALLGKKLPKEFGYIKGLKDMITIELTAIRENNDDSETKFQCPIAGLEINGKYKFFALKNCGHVLSAKALKEVKSCVCLVCHQAFDEEDKIVINGSDEEVAELKEKMEVEKALRVGEKKKKKKKKMDSSECLESTRLSGSKHGEIENEKGTKNNNASVKRFKATDIAPAHATSVYASIFTSAAKSDFKETYSCRSLPLGRN